RGSVGNLGECYLPGTTTKNSPACVFVTGDGAPSGNRVANAKHIIGPPLLRRCPACRSTIRRTKQGSHMGEVRAIVRTTTCTPCFPGTGTKRIISNTPIGLCRGPFVVKGVLLIKWHQPHPTAAII